MIIKIKIILLVFLIVSGITISAQNEGEVIDASKPTNFYSFIDNTLELSNQPNQNIFGYRGKVTYSPSGSHLLLGEVPLLYNDRTSKFGLGDLRVRYFYLPYKNYDNLIGAFGPSVDVFAPTGNFNDGLGSGRWIISPGVTVGIMAAEVIQFFPILSYQYASEPVVDFPDGMNTDATHGITFQVITPIVISDSFFVQVTPVFKMNNIGDEREDRYIQELFAAYSINPGMQITGFYNGNFEDKIHQISAGLTIFF